MVNSPHISKKISIRSENKKKPKKIITQCFSTRFLMEKKTWNWWALFCG